MKLIYKLSLVIFTFLFLTHCKKGEDDPSFSLKTRKSRLSGEWRLESGKASYTSGVYNESFTFDGFNLILHLTSQYPIYYTGKYTLGLTIDKDGKFSFKEDYASQILESKGTWNFNAGIGKEKSKESIVFFIDKVEKGYTEGNNLFNRGSIAFEYKIKELRNKRLVIYSQGKIYSESKGTYATLSTEYVFHQ